MVGAYAYWSDEDGAGRASRYPANKRPYWHRTLTEEGYDLEEWVPLLRPLESHPALSDEEALEQLQSGNIDRHAKFTYDIATGADHFSATVAVSFSLYKLDQGLLLSGDVRADYPVTGAPVATGYEDVAAEYESPCFEPTPEEENAVGALSVPVDHRDKEDDTLQGRMEDEVNSVIELCRKMGRAQDEIVGAAEMAFDSE